MFWSEDSNAINFFKELAVQKRFDDLWYGAFLNECRYGDLSDESYNSLHGLPTEHAGSWQQNGTLTCGNAMCAGNGTRELFGNVNAHSFLDHRATRSNLEGALGSCTTISFY